MSNLAEILEGPLKAAEYRPYDLVQDDTGWTFAVKGICESGELLVKAVYAPPGILPRKYKERPAIVWSSAHVVPCSVSSLGDYLLSPLCCSYLQPRALTKAAMNGGNPIAAEVASLIEQSGARVELAGSRRAGLHRRESDWDLLVLGVSHPIELVRLVLAVIEHRGRLYRRPEIVERARRYSSCSSHASFSTLVALFGRTTLYLRTNHGEVGLFFDSPDPPLLPDLRAVSGIVPLTISGQILPCSGTSYHMPRRFRIATNVMGIIEIWTPIWEFGGLEELAGKRVSLTSLRQISPLRYWLGGPNVRLELSNG